MMDIVIENLHHPSPAIRRTSVKTIKDLEITSNQAVEGMVSCLVQGTYELQQDALNALRHLLGKNVYSLNHKKFYIFTP
jgi:hypothetical protein